MKSSKWPLREVRGESGRDAMNAGARSTCSFHSDLEVKELDSSPLEKAGRVNANVKPWGPQTFLSIHSPTTIALRLAAVDRKLRLVLHYCCVPDLVLASTNAVQLSPVQLACGYIFLYCCAVPRCLRRLSPGPGVWCTNPSRRQHPRRFPSKRQAAYTMGPKRAGDLDLHLATKLPKLEQPASPLTTQLTPNSDFSGSVKRKLANSSRTGQACDRCKVASTSLKPLCATRVTEC